MPQPLGSPRSLSEKYNAIQEIAGVWARRFPRLFDELVGKELDRILNLFEDSFIEQRSAEQMTRLAYTTCFARKKLTRNIESCLFTKHFDIRIFPSLLQYTFYSKPVLSIVAHAHLKNRYELFHEDQLLSIIQRVFPEAQLVSDSVCERHFPRSTIKMLYFEICKKSGSPFTIAETIHLKKLLQQEIPYSIEKVTPSIFMIPNAEEMFKNILTMSREIHRASDPPQAMILFDQQILQDVLCAVIVVAVRKQGQHSLQEDLKNIQEYAECLTNRCQTVRYIGKTHRVEATVFKIKIPKDQFLRTDGAVHFHLVRQKIGQLLTKAIGPFRDYNGGIISKQMETLSSFKEAFPCISPDLIENFYYSLSPIETQTSLPLELLGKLFELFLEARNAETKKSSDFFLKTFDHLSHLMISIRVPDADFNVDHALDSLNCNQKTVSYSLFDQDSYFSGHLVEAIDDKTKQQLSQTVTNALMSWKQQAENRQVLRLSLFSPVVSLDPRMGGERNSSIILRLLFEGLMRMNRHGELENGLAQHVEISPDQKIYTFRLRNALWSDGSPVLAQDFEYAWKTVLSPSFNTPFAYLFYSIKNAKRAKKGAVSAGEIGVTVLDKYTLKVELEFPSPYFLELTTLSAYSPVHRSLDQRHPNWPFEDKNGYICNGAFQLNANNFNDRYELVKNQTYWDRENIKLDEIVILRDDLRNPYEMFRRGMSHWVEVRYGMQPPSFDIGEEDESIPFTNDNVFWVVFNTTRFPFNNKKLRQALALGINRPKLQTQHNLTPAISPVPPEHSQLKCSILSTYSLEEAQKLFKEALQELDLFVENFPVISIIHPNTPSNNQVLALIKEEWASAFGIRCNLTPLKWNPFFSEFSKGDFQVGSISWETCVEDPMYTLNSFAEGTFNFPKWTNQDYQKSIALAQEEPDSGKRLEYYAQAEKILLEEMPVIPVVLFSSFVLKKKAFVIENQIHRSTFKWGQFVTKR